MYVQQFDDGCHHENTKRESILDQDSSIFVNYSVSKPCGSLVRLHSLHLLALLLVCTIYWCPSRLYTRVKPFTIQTLMMSQEGRTYVMVSRDWTHWLNLQPPNRWKAMKWEIILVKPWSWSRCALVGCFKCHDSVGSNVKKVEPHQNSQTHTDL